MKRFLIFALLWPPIGLFIGYTLTEGRGNMVDGLGMTVALAIPAYLFLIAPALGLALVDKMLEQNPLRLFAVCLLAAVLTPIVFAHGSDGTPQKVLAFAVAGLVPTFFCSLLANWKTRKDAAGAVEG